MINIYTFEDIKDEIKREIRNHRLIPIIGAGFSKNENAVRGKVPSGQEMKNYMRECLKKVLPDEEKELDKMDFKKLGKYYLKRIKKEERDIFLKNRFTKVNIGGYKEKFIKINWPCIYTLNYDDSLERINEYKVVLPYKEIESSVREEEKCIFKLHGDANYEITYSDSTSSLIFSIDDYMKSLNKNENIMKFFEEDYVGNNIMYVGCSLQDELDILYSVYNTENIEQYKVERYYIIDRKPSEFEISDLEDYKITKIVIVNNFNEFYKEMSIMYENIRNIEEDELSPFYNIRFNKNEMNDKQLLESLLLSIEENNENKDINSSLSYNLPNYYTKREIATKILNNMERNNIHVIMGHRITGKTYLIFNIIQSISDRDIYYFPSKVLISRKALGKILQKENLVIFFDSNSIAINEINYLSDNIELLKNKNIYVYIFLNSSDKIISSTLRKNGINIEEKLKNTFEKKEVDRINEKLKLRIWPKFSERMSILDNLYQYEMYVREHYENVKLSDVFIDQPNDFSEPELMIFILLAANDRILNSELKALGLNNKLDSILRKYSTIIQVENTERVEKSFSSGFKLVANAKNWILNSIGEYSIDSQNKEKITLTIKKMVKCFRADRRHFETSIQLILFDTLNDIFHNKKGGASTLIKRIYEELEDELNDDNQYLIQRAKSILYLSNRDIKRLHEAARFADTACINLNNELLSEKRIKKREKLINVINHCNFTKAMIYGRIINLEKYCNKKNIINAIENYYNAFKSEYNIDYTHGLMKKTLEEKKKGKSDLMNLIDYTRSEEIMDNKSRVQLEFIIKTMIES